MAFILYLLYLETILKEIISLDSNKATLSNDVPARNIKENVYLFSVYLSELYNESIIFETLPSAFKLADITPNHIKEPRLEEFSYGLVSLLLKIQKTSEK